MQQTWVKAWALCILLASVEAVIVRRLSPTSGSLCGGTRLSIHGSGLSGNISTEQVLIGKDECKIETATPTLLVCQVPFRDAQVATGKETLSELVTVTSGGVPVPMAEPLEFTFKAEDAPLIVDFGPTSGQANDVLSFQGNSVLFGASVEMSGQECKVKGAKGGYLQCVPPPREAGISDIHVYFGPERGFACQGPKAPPLKFIYNLMLQSVSPADWGAEASGPYDGQGGNLVVVGQGLGNSTVFKLCGGDTWCSPQSPPALDPAMYHGGDWSFQTVTCKPGPLENGKAATEIRKCDFIAEAAEGMFRSVLQDAWTYAPATTTSQTLTTAAPAPAMPSPAPANLPAAHLYYPSPAPAVAAPPLASASAPAAVPMLSPAPVPALLPMPMPILVPSVLSLNPSQQQDAPAPASAKEEAKDALQHAATHVLKHVFERLASELGREDQESQEPSTPSTQSNREPSYPVTQQALAPTHVYAPPPSPAALTLVERPLGKGVLRGGR